MSTLLHLMILTCALNQVARDHQILKTARDCFQFATNFFEVISVSATHIYHSALELSPLSSIVRKLYYHQRPHPSPKVVIGIKDSWGAATAVSTKHPYYLSSTWSPCGQFVAVVANEAVEIWDALTLKLSSTLHPTNVTTKFRHGLAYSPDGCSIAACSNTGIVVWDIQTGGEATKIECEVTGDGLQLVWSLDGKMICTVSPTGRETVIVNVYNSVSGAKVTTSTLQSCRNAYLWAHGKSFQIAITTESHKGWTISIYEVGPTLTRTESFHLQINSQFTAFSPTSYRAAVFTTGGYQHVPELLISDIRTSEVLLRTTVSYKYCSFSLDGDFFAASAGGHLHIWRYTSGQYIQWKECPQFPGRAHFSPTSSSILNHTGAFLRILNLDSSAAPTMESTPTVHNQFYDAFSPHGTFIVTACPGGSTITITNLNPQNPFPSQFIDTNLEISAMVLTGNVLLVTGSERMVAWLLTDKGAVDGILGNTRADHNDSLWDIIPKAPFNCFHESDGRLGFSVIDEIAVIYMHGYNIHTYHTRTGEILEPNQSSQYFGNTVYRFHHPQRRDDWSHYSHDLCKNQRPPECGWPISETTLREGWVKDPEGKHRLWLHAYWRTAGSNVGWLYNATTLRLGGPSELLIVKF